MKYKELDGEDVTIVVSPSEHAYINREAVKERGFSIPRKIISAAASRTRQKKRNFNTVRFFTEIENRTQLIERIIYNPDTGYVYSDSQWRRN